MFFGFRGEIVKDKLIKGIFLIFVANTINMVFSILTNLLLPKFLSVDAYADIKTFQLCLTYIGILHFGFNDGMYLKYGGKDFYQMQSSDLNCNFSTIQFAQTLMLVVGVLLGFFLGNKMVLFTALTLMPYNMMNYFKSLYQACGEFKAYGKILNAGTAGIFIVNIVLLLFLKIENATYYILGYIFLYYIIWGCLVATIRKNVDVRFSLKNISTIELKENIEQGFLLMLGNFSSTFITSMDRWFVKFLLNTIAFAQYSFAVSMENFLNVAITPLTTTLYNYFCKDCSVEAVSSVRKKTIVFACGLIAAAFPVKLLIRFYLPKYIDSEKVIFLLFASQAFYVVNKSVYNNLYKAKKMQNRYFRNLLITVIIAFVFNVIGFEVMHLKEGFAWGTLFSAVVWLIIVIFDFREYRLELKEVVVLAVLVSTLLLCGNVENAVLGFGIYGMIYMIVIFLAMRESAISLVNTVINFIRGKKGDYNE